MSTGEEESVTVDLLKGKQINTHLENYPIEVKLLTPTDLEHRNWNLYIQ